MPTIDKRYFSSKMKRIIGRAETEEYDLIQAITSAQDMSKVTSLQADLASIVEAKLELADAAQAESEGRVTPKQQKVLDDVDLAYRIQEVKKDSCGKNDPCEATKSEAPAMEFDPGWSLQARFSRLNNKMEVGPRGEFLGDVLPVVTSAPPTIVLTDTSDGGNNRA